MRRPNLFRFRRFLIRDSLRFQLLSRSLLVMAALLLLIGIFQYVFMKDFIYKNKASSIHSGIMSLPPNAWHQIALNSPGNGSGRPPWFSLPDSSISFIDPDGNFTAISNWSETTTAPRLPVETYREALLQKPGMHYSIVQSDPGGEQLLVLHPVEAKGRLLGLVQVSTGTKPLKEVLLRQLVTFLALSTLALVVGLMMFVPVLKRTLVPLSNMGDAVERIDAGNLAERFPADQGQAEIDRLALSFNGMLERLEASFAAEKEAKEQMRRFVADASHELRTPLTSIHGFLEVLLRGAMNQPEQLQKALESMYGESERIRKLVQDLLLLAKLDRKPELLLTEGELDMVIKEMEPQLRLLAGGRKVSFRTAPGTICRYDEDKMKQVILNLFHNAVQHTDPETGEIEVSLTSASGKVQFAVQDNGLGISSEHLPYLFDRFYRIDSSRTRKNGGAGLGLSITKSIVEVLGGTIGVESRIGEGSRFYVTLPAA